MHGTHLVFFKRNDIDNSITLYNQTTIQQESDFTIELSKKRGVDYRIVNLKNDNTLATNDNELKGNEDLKQRILLFYDLKNKVFKVVNDVYKNTISFLEEKEKNSVKLNNLQEYIKLNAVETVEGAELISLINVALKQVPEIKIKPKDHKTPIKSLCQLI